MFTKQKKQMQSGSEKLTTCNEGITGTQFFQHSPLDGCVISLSIPFCFSHVIGAHMMSSMQTQRPGKSSYQMGNRQKIAASQIWSTWEVVQRFPNKLLQQDSKSAVPCAARHCHRGKSHNR